MNGATLLEAMQYPGYDAPLPLARYTELVPVVESGLRRAGCTTQRRISMALAQMGAESGSLRWSEELADGREYNMRADLGNTQPGDGPRFKGRSYIQITGRTHYTNLSTWAFSHGYVPTSTYFLDHPERLAWDQYVMLGFVWYWTVARPQMNTLADAGDIGGATYAVNGGYNNLAGRTARWNKCRGLGDALLLTPTPTPTPRNEDDDMARIYKSANSKDGYPVLVDGPVAVTLPHLDDEAALKKDGVHEVVVSSDLYKLIKARTR